MHRTLKRTYFSRFGTRIPKSVYLARKRRARLKIHRQWLSDRIIKCANESYIFLVSDINWKPLFVHFGYIKEKPGALKNLFQGDKLSAILFPNFSFPAEKSIALTITGNTTQATGESFYLHFPKQKADFDAEAAGGVVTRWNLSDVVYRDEKDEVFEKSTNHTRKVRINLRLGNKSCRMYLADLKTKNPQLFKQISEFLKFE